MYSVLNPFPISKNLLCYFTAEKKLMYQTVKNLLIMWHTRINHVTYTYLSASLISTRQIRRLGRIRAGDSTIHLPYLCQPADCIDGQPVEVTWFICASGPSTSHRQRISVTSFMKLVLIRCNSNSQRTLRNPLHNLWHASTWGRRSLPRLPPQTSMIHTPHHCKNNEWCDKDVWAVIRPSHSEGGANPRTHPLGTVMGSKGGVTQTHRPHIHNLVEEDTFG